MAVADIDPDIIKGYIAARDCLIFWLTEQNAPSPEQVAPLWQAFELLRDEIEQIKKLNGFEEEMVTFRGNRLPDAP